MAWLEEHPTSGHFKICFRFGNRKFKKTIKTTARSEAEGAVARIEENLRLLERGRLELPPDADIGTFLLSDGKLTSKPVLSAPPPALLLKELCETYLGVQSHGAIEANSLSTIRMHLRHMTKTLGEDFPIATLEVSHLQNHIDRRSRKRYRGRPLSATTLRKEIATFRACWNWGVHAGKLMEIFPGRGLKYPKTDEKPPFQTWEEIERQIARGVTAAEVRDLWDCLFLTLPEIAELLEFVKVTARQPFIYPMFCLAAHTGARRSEMLRARINDVDLEAATVTIHERKRDKEKRTSRRVALAPFLVGVLKEWLANHPGGQYLFCLGLQVFRSKKKRIEFGPVTRDEASDHFKRTLADSKWDKLRGWHVFRHSFVSNCAAKNIDQRIIDEWTGHQTEEMRRRYRHLFPHQQQAAIRVVFGEGQ